MTHAHMRVLRDAIVFPEGVTPGNISTVLMRAMIGCLAHFVQPHLFLVHAIELLAHCALGVDIKLLWWKRVMGD